MQKEKWKNHIEKLSKALQERNKESLVLIHEHYYHRIKGYITSSVGSDQDADDLTQDVFIELSKKSNQNNDYKNPIAYLFGITRNIIKRHIEKQNKSVQTIPITAIDKENTYKSEQKDSFEQILNSERKQIIEQAIAKLHPKSRQAIKLRFIDGLSIKEASEIEQCSPKVFSQRLYEGINTLKDIIFEHKNDTYKKIV